MRRECHALARTTRAALNSATGLPALCPDEDGWFGQMAGVLLPACDADAFAKRLRDEFRIEVPVRDWNGRQVLRFSIQGYNTQADADALVTAVRALVTR
jgi:selenocysteine lyase/cysteine desulfurase